MRTRLATFSNREWVSITSQTEKKTPMNYIIINKTKNISDFGNYSNIQVLVKSRTLVRSCKHNTFRIGFRHNMQIHNPQDRLHYTSSKKNRNLFYIDTYRLKRNI